MLVRSFHKPSMAGKNTPILENLLDQDGSVDYCEQFIPSDCASSLFDRLISGTAWQQESIQIGSKIMNCPRLTFWMGDPGTRYRFSGKNHHPAAWSDDLLDLRDRVTRVTQLETNSVLLNYYRNGNDSVAWHSDNEPDLGTDPSIVSISLGCARTFEIRHKQSRSSKRITLPHGSLLWMHGPFQSRWEHRVAKQPWLSTPRINLTFRLVFKRPDGSDYSV